MDQKDQENPSPPPPLTRREFIKRLTQAVLGTAAGVVATGPVIAGLRKPESVTKLITPSSVSPSITEEHPLTLASVEQSKPTPTPQPKETEKPLTNVRSYIEGHVLVTPTLEQDKKLAVEVVLKQIKHLLQDPQALTILQRVAAHQETVQRIADVLGFYPSSYARSVFLAMILVESKGDKLADNNPRYHDSAKGLAQVKPSTAKEVAQQINMTTSPNLFNPEINIAIGLEYLDNLQQLFHNPGLAVWAFNLGPGYMIDLLKEYLLSSPTRSFTEKLRLRASFKNPRQLFREIQQSSHSEDRLNFFQLIHHPQVIKYLKAIAAHEETSLYIPRVIAANWLLDNYFDWGAKNPSTFVTQVKQLAQTTS